jgi:hypothetical protein
VRRERRRGKRVKRVKKRGILPRAESREEREGAKKGNEGRGGSSGELPSPLDDGTKHRPPAVPGSGGAWRERRSGDVTEGRGGEEVSDKYGKE